MRAFLRTMLTAAALVAELLLLAPQSARADGASAGLSPTPPVLLPEPSSASMLSVGVTGLIVAGWARRRRSEC